MMILKNIKYNISPFLKEVRSRFKIIQLIFKVKSIKFGRRCIIDWNSSFSAYNMIGDYSRIFNSHLGIYSYIGPFSIVIDTIIGKYCSIGPDVKIGLGYHPINYLSTSPYLYDSKLYGSLVTKDYEEQFKQVVIGNDVWIGANVLIAGGVKIGDGAVIGAGAFVNKDVEPYSIVVGTPARHIRYRLENEIIEEIQKDVWWNWDLAKLKKNADSFLKPHSFYKK